MAGGSGRIQDGGGRPNVARVTDGELHVRVTGGGGGGGGNVVITAPLPLPVSDNGGSLTVDGTVDVGNFPAIQTVDGTVDVGNFPATQTVDGTVDVGNFPATQTVDGTVSVGSVIPGTGAANLGKAEDSPHASGDVGVMLLAVRQDTPAAFGANGDYAPLASTSNGSLRVSVNGTTTVGGSVSVTSVTPGAGATDLGKAEDAVHASGDVGVMSLAVRRDAESSVAGDGDYHPLLLNSTGRLKSTATMQIGTTDVGAGNPVPITDNGGTLTVDGTVMIDSSTPVDVAITGQPIQVIMAEARRVLSNSVGGQAIVVTIGGALINLSPASTVEQVYLWLSNTSDFSDTVQIDLGSGGFPIEVFSPAHETVIALDGTPIDGDVAPAIVTAKHVNVASVIHAFGHVIRNP